ncbi:MAG: hypothetical protein EF813_03070 [Methanosarcinales archaeon]|nr:MAG: hypothetical protein EF813_03070 [Methanosarcinales archaeon]
MKSSGKIMLIAGRRHDPTIDLRLPRFLGKIIAVITEKQSPRMFMSYYDGIRDQLPFFDGIWSDHIVDLFTNTGLKKT